MKNFVSFLLLFFSLAFLFGCGQDDSLTVDSPVEQFDVYYVENGQILKNVRSLSSLPSEVMKEWLILNKLDDDFEIVGMYIKDDISEENRTPITSYRYEYDCWEFYFSSDISSFLEQEDNKLYKDSLEQTLENALSVLERRVDELID